MVNDKARITFSYTSNKQECEWFEQGSSGKSLKFGYTYLTFALSTSGRWKGSSDPARPNLLKLEFDPLLKWNTTKEAYQPTFAEKLLHQGRYSSILPEFYFDLKVPKPSLDLQMEPLEYFLTTNLLLPGVHMFHADDPAPPSDRSCGLAMPRDIILTGSITTRLN
jgi:hypothetical protein